MAPLKPEGLPGPTPEDSTPEGAARRSRGRGGRAAEEPTVQVSLRLPASWVARLRQRALAATAREENIITPQEIMRRIISLALRTEE